MPGTFIAAMFMAVLAALFAAAYRLLRSRVEKLKAADDRSRDGQDKLKMTIAGRVAAKGAAWVLGSLTALLVLVSAFNPVSTQNIGIVLDFGRPAGHLANGPQFTWPWQTVTEMDEAIQVTDFDPSACQIQLRLADGQTACAKAAVRWRINPSAADALFRNYRNSTAGVENGLLIPEFQNAANTVFASYDPVALLDSPAPAGSPANPTVPQLAQQVQTLLSSKIGSEIQVISLFIPNITYSQTVQDRINAVLAQKAATLVAQQSEQTASAQAAANRAVSASVSNDPGVLESRCLDILAEMVKAGQSVPAGFSCFPGGSGTGVIANASR